MTKSSLQSVAFATVFLLTPVALRAHKTASQVMMRNFFVGKVRALRSRVLLVLKSQDGYVQKRRLRIVLRLERNEIYSDLMIRFSYPYGIRGTSFLEKQQADGRDALWIYLPALHNVRRLVGNDKRNSFFGTDFSYGDILPSRVSDYRYKRLPDAVVDGHPCYVVESWPINKKIERDTGYSRKLSWIRKDDFVAIRVKFYSRRGTLLKVLTARDVKPLGTGGTHWVAWHIWMHNKRSGHSTLFQVNSLRTNVHVGREYFSVGTLRRR